MIKSAISFVRLPRMKWFMVIHLLGDPLFFFSSFSFQLCAGLWLRQQSNGQCDNYLFQRSDVFACHPCLQGWMGGGSGRLKFQKRSALWIIRCLFSAFLQNEEDKWHLAIEVCFGQSISELAPWWNFKAFLQHDLVFLIHGSPLMHFLNQRVGCFKKEF